MAALSIFLELHIEVGFRLNIKCDQCDNKLPLTIYLKLYMEKKENMLISHVISGKRWQDFQLHMELKFR